MSARKKPLRRPRGGWPTLASVGAAAVIAACGGSGPKPSTSGRPSLFEVARCMREHRVSNFPDPAVSPGGQGFAISASPGSSTVTINGITFSGPAFVSAEKTCKLFGGGNGPPAVSESQKRGMIANAHCIRAHGVPNFPDPTFGQGVGLDLGPGENPHSPAIQRAARACAHVGTPIPGVGFG